MEVNIYTDGSCNPQLKIGGWAAILLTDGQKIICKGIEKNVTHQQMELLAVVNSIVYLENNNLSDSTILIYSDSQYVVGLVERKQKLKQANFKTGAGVPIRNSELVQHLIHYIEIYQLQFVKVTAHAKGSLHQSINREVDMLIRKELRSFY